MNDWGPGTGLGDTTEDDWKMAFAAGGIPQARQQHLIAVLHEARQLLEPDSTHPLPPHASDQPDTPWPERETSESDSAATPFATLAVVLLTVAFLSQNRTDTAAVDGPPSNKRVNKKQTTAKTLAKKRGKQQRVRSSSPSVSPGASKARAGGGTTKSSKAKS
jgi:hypothetical protein